MTRISVRAPRLARRAVVVALLATTAMSVGAAGALPADRHRSARGEWPMSPRPVVVHGFAPPSTRYGRGHRGVDLAGRPGQVVRAALAGRVRFAGRVAGRGVVVVDHGATRTTYEPVLASVNVGDLVARGAPVGRLQLGGSHCLPRWCLHWGLLEGRDHYLDPLALVGAVPVVLLPQRLLPRPLLPDGHAWRPVGSAAPAPLSSSADRCGPPRICRTTPALWP